MALAPACPATAEEPDLATYMAGLPACLDAAPDTPGAEACIGRFAETCMNDEDGGFSTLGMSMCTQAETEAWDALLNREYQRAMADAKLLDAEDMHYFPGFAVRAEKLRDAQRAWITFRDAECELEYATGGSGSIRHIFGTSCFLQMTAERTIDLRFLWDGLK